jgi:hypothetical protein
MQNPIWLLAHDGSKELRIEAKKRRKRSKNASNLNNSK